MRRTALAIPALLAVGLIRLEAAPVWKAPEEIAFGQLAVLELREDDPAKPTIPRPAEEKMGSLALRSVVALPDGRGWKLTVQALTAGTAIIPPMDLGDGRRTPELRVRVPRTVPYGAPWVAVGGGQTDILPYVPFPWGWASLLLIPPGLLGYGFLRRWQKNRTKRRLHHLRRTFAHHWPPGDHRRETLDKAHSHGRDLLAARFGEETRSWGVAEFRGHHLEVWATWVQSLDAARFARKDPPFPPLADLLKKLEAK